MKRTTVIGACLLAGAGIYWVVEAGSLEPPGPPEPTMVTLEEIDARLDALGAAQPIPISEPMAITEPGSYIVTQNITNSRDRVISVSSDKVYLDLNGFTVASGSNAWALGIWGDDVAVVNGVIDSDGAGSAVYIGDSLRFELRNLRLFAGNLGHGVEADSCAYGLIENCSVYAPGSSGVFITSGCPNVSVVNNTVSEVADYGISVGTGARVVGNAVYATRSDFESIAAWGDDNVIQHNRVRDVLSGNGIGVYGDYNYIEGNVVTEAFRCGLRISGDNNLYRGNTVRNSGEGTCICDGSGTTDFCDEGTNNISHGDNYMPAQM